MHTLTMTHVYSTLWYIHTSHHDIGKPYDMCMPHSIAFAPHTYYDMCVPYCDMYTLYTMIYIHTCFPMSEMLLCFSGKIATGTPLREGGIFP